MSLRVHPAVSEDAALLNEKHPYWKKSSIMAHVLLFFFRFHDWKALSTIMNYDPDSDSVYRIDITKIY